jgi:hypothetical protein
VSRELDNIRTRADRAAAVGASDAAVFESWLDVPALLALVDAQAARIDKALAICAELYAPDAWVSVSIIRRALTEDVTP